jgi:general secretion pathway protein C
VRGASFALWALVAASIVYWGFRLAGGQASVTAPVPAPRPVPVDPVAIARLLGGSPAGLAAPAAAPSLASRFQLTGVVAGVRSGGGVAVISVDGKPARSFRVGAAIEEGVVLQSVRGRQAVLAAAAEGPALVTLELPLRGAPSSQSPIAASQATIPAPQVPIPAPPAPIPAPQAPISAPQASVPAPQASIPAPQAPTAAPR